MNGGDCLVIVLHNFKKLSFLSQTSSSSGCEKNWSVFERIHKKGEIEWSIKGYMILFMLHIICANNSGI